MIKRAFSKELYDAYDGTAKATLVKILENEGHEIVAIAENYYADVMSMKDGVPYYSEAEIKRGWTGEWPESWTDIRIPERKTRLLQKYKDKVNFYVFSNDLSQCWCITGDQLTQESLATAKGRYIVVGEKFFHIPYKEAKLIKCKSQ